MQNPAFADFDPLQVWREESAKRGIALHAWIDGLAVGNTLGDGIGPILTKHPEWAAVDRDHAETGEPHPSPNGFYWLDVSDPVARQYFVDVMIETVSTYGLDGLNIDYMRYPESDDWRKAYNFSVDSRNRFTVAHGIDPMTLSPDTTPEDWATWETFVESEENRLVADLSKRLDEEAPDAVLSAAPENGTEAAKIHQWSDLVDVVIPQAYTRHLPSIHDAVADMDARMKGGQLTYTGIAPLYEHVPVYDSVQQTVAAKDIDAGTTVFSFGQASAPAVDALSKGPWRGTAVAPGLRPVAAVKAQMRGVRTDIDQVYLPRKGVDRKVAAILHRRLAAMHDDLPDAPSKGRLRALDKELEALATSVEQARRRGQMAQPVAVNVLTRIAESRRIVSYAIARDRR